MSGRGNRDRMLSSLSMASGTFVSFSVDEMFAMAERIEVNGARFYRAAAAQVSDDAMQQTLNWLAEEEDKHEQTFVQMRRELEDKDQGADIHRCRREIMVRRALFRLFVENW